jgi:chromosomal replication initiation ATPase DnaA
MKIKDVDRVVSRAFGIRLKDIRIRNQHREFVDARQMVWLLLKDEGFSVMELSRRYERNHAAICKGITRMRGLIEVHRKIEAIYNEVKEELCY